MTGKWWTTADSTKIFLRPPEQATSKGDESLQMNLTSSMRHERTRDSFAVDEVVIEQCTNRSARGYLEMYSLGIGSLVWSKPPERQKGSALPRCQGLVAKDRSHRPAQMSETMD